MTARKEMEKLVISKLDIFMPASVLLAIWALDVRNKGEVRRLKNGGYQVRFKR